MVGDVSPSHAYEGLSPEQEMVSKVQVAIKASSTPPPPESTHRIVRVCGHSCRREVCAPAPLGAAELAAALDEDSLAELLHPVSFARTKARRRRA